MTAEPRKRPTTSVYERLRLSPPAGEGERWTPVGELDPTSGEWLEPPADGWERRAQGWQPLGELLRDRWQ